MKLNEVIAKYGNQEVDESKIKEVLGVKKSKVWKPNDLDAYYFFYSNGDIQEAFFASNQPSEKRYALGICYKTPQEAEFARDKQIFLTKFERYLRENEDNPMDWSSDSQKKYCVAFDAPRECAYADYWVNTLFQGTIFTTNEKALIQFIKDNESEIKKYMFEVE